MAMVIDEFVNNRGIDGKFRDELLGLDQQTSDIVGRLIQSLRPSANTLRVWWSLARDIAARDAIELGTVFLEPEIEVLISEATNGNLKTRQSRLREQLERRRYPEVTRLRSELDASIRQVVDDIGVRIQLPKDLEGSDLRLELSFSSPEAAKRLGEQLQAVASHPATKRIFSILRGEP